MDGVETEKLEKEGESRARAGGGGAAVQSTGGVECGTSRGGETRERASERSLRAKVRAAGPRKEGDKIR